MLTICTTHLILLHLIILIIPDGSEWWRANKLLHQQGSSVIRFACIFNSGTNCKGR
jgi:hypothetical protein